MEKKDIVLTAKHGFINELAKLCNCNRATVRRALFEGRKGEKADLVRRMYHLKYVQPYKKTED